ncbi:hypothetical protein Thiowin_01344 [Thiorhodovibrio winogradskyi]|uniref:Uncharacterized protein n=1 Tax=Thiorhodovibrio winogradskyi TaxID=77007 RepID=A0ABZ0S9Z6_9GAMM
MISNATRLRLVNPIHGTVASMTGAIFAAIEDLKRSRVIDGNHALAESQLQEFELFQ